MIVLSPPFIGRPVDVVVLCKSMAIKRDKKLVRLPTSRIDKDREKTTMVTALGVKRIHTYGLKNRATRLVFVEFFRTLTISSRFCL